jgi:hypothetical protein
MHRIIIRTVTIVTTTILTISWQEDVLPPDPPGRDEFSQPDISSEMVQHPVQRTGQFPRVMEGKEVEVSVTKPMKQHTADEPPNNAYFYQSKKGNQKP